MCGYTFPVHDSLWFTTRSALFLPGDHAWDEVARYEAPLRRLLARRYARQLEDATRDDLVQDALIEIKESLTRTYDRSRGRFRALLQTVVARRVVDALRRKRPDPLPPGELTAPTPEAFDDLDLEAGLIDAVTACRDRFSGGPHKDLDALHALSDRLIHGKTSVQIAAEAGVRRDVISRRLAKARDVIYTHLLAAELSLPPDDPALARCVVAFRKLLRTPSDARATLDALPDHRESLEAFWTRFRAALPRFRGDETAAGRELAEGVALILGD